jgi:hypothetical protein
MQSIMPAIRFAAWASHLNRKNGSHTSQKGAKKKKSAGNILPLPRPPFLNYGFKINVIRTAVRLDKFVFILLAGS